MKIRKKSRNELFFPEGKYLDAKEISERYKNHSYLKESDPVEMPCDLDENIEIVIKIQQNDKFDKN